MMSDRNFTAASRNVTFVALTKMTPQFATNFDEGNGIMERLCGVTSASQMAFVSFLEEVSSGIGNGTHAFLFTNFIRICVISPKIAR